MLIGLARVTSGTVAAVQLDEGALKAAPQTMKRLAAEIGRGFDDLDDVEVAELRAALGRLMPDRLRLRLRLGAQKPDLLGALRPRSVAGTVWSG
jgi:hypothetical protein